MINVTGSMRLNLLRLLMLVMVAPLAVAQQARMEQVVGGFRVVQGTSVIEVSAVESGVLRVDVKPSGVKDLRTPVMDPGFHAEAAAGLQLRRTGTAAVVQTSRYVATLKPGPLVSLEVTDRQGTVLLTEENVLKDALAQGVEFVRDDDDPVYGIDGIDMNVKNASLTRSGEIGAKAGIQGNGGAPLFFTRRYAVLVDSVGGGFSIDGNKIGFHEGSRKELEFFIVVGDPLETRKGLADLSGHSPMPPRWALGFMNSQWGLSESEMREIVLRYRTEHIPLDGFIMDFDWKAWGEDNYGEWRWNSTSGEGSRAPNLFPDGASGKLAADMRAQGVHLVGIMKPRILTYKPGSTTDLDEAASYAEQHGFWYPGEPETIDYFTHRPSRDLNFNLPETRAWFWEHLQPAFDAGVEGFWNDEADRTDVAKQEFRFNDLQHFNMARAEHDGQRAHSDKRVWTINRNYYLGSQRYGYAEWSGDIKTSTESMAQQPVRMLASLNIGEEHWSMDTGGFIGHPTAENYARWMEFAAFVPVFRVHGALHEKRQPWVYGPVAQAAADHAIELRYTLMPYLYAAEAAGVESGVGLVRPLSWIFPEDATAAAQTEEWMFGDALLVAPVLEEKATKSIYLPAGTWWEYGSGKRWEGLQSIAWTVDTEKWSDIPLFVRAGSIVATNAVADATDAMHPEEITLDVYPASKSTAFNYYEDDGATYAYEKGAFYQQEISAVQRDGNVTIRMMSPVGSFKPAVKTFLIRVHGTAASSMSAGGMRWMRATSDSEEPGIRRWTAGTDRFGPVTTLKVDAGRAAAIELR